MDSLIRKTQTYSTKTPDEVEAAIQDVTNRIRNPDTVPFAVMGVGRPPRVRVTIEFFDDKCRSCGKQLEVGKECNYADYTYCYKCKSNEEEFEEECS